MKLAEKLAAMSDGQATKEEAVINEIVNFFAEKFESGEMMDTFESVFGKKISVRERRAFFLIFGRIFRDATKPISGYSARNGSQKTATVMNTRELILKTSTKMFFSQLLNSQEKTLKRRI